VVPTREGGMKMLRVKNEGKSGRGKKGNRSDPRIPQSSLKKRLGNGPGYSLKFRSLYHRAGFQSWEYLAETGPEQRKR